MVGERFGKRRIAFHQMHGNDSIERTRIVLMLKWSAQCVLAAGFGTKADQTKRGAAAGSAAESDSGHRANHVAKARDVCLGPFGLVRKRLAIGGAVQHLEGFG